jgi:hypothetical protein
LFFFLISEVFFNCEEDNALLEFLRFLLIITQQNLITTLKICEKQQMEINSIIKFYETQSPEAMYIQKHNFCSFPATNDRISRTLIKALFEKYINNISLSTFVTDRNSIW